VPDTAILVNRAPALTLWAAVVAERLGYGREEALSLGRAVAGLNAQSKGRRLGIYAPRADDGADTGRAKATRVPLTRREVPVVKTAGGIRADALAAARLASREHLPHS
jgi:hypothetical protein